MPNLEYLRKFDSKPYQFSPNFNKNGKYGSPTGGIISLVCKLIFILILTMKTIDLIGRTQIYYNMNIIKSNDLM